MNKLRKTFIILKIMYNPSLLLSLHVFLLAILFGHWAFEEGTGLYKPKDLCTLKPNLVAKKLPLPLKAEFRDVYVFR